MLGSVTNNNNSKDIPEAAMVSTPEGFTKNSSIYPTTPTIFKKPSAGKSLCLFTNILDVKRKTAIRRVRSDKSKRKAIKLGTTPWALKPKRKLNPRINY